MSDSPQIIVLFSGGLDSLLTAKLLERQGLAVRCLHFYSPFFGGEAVAARWRKIYDLDIATQDVGPQFAAMLRQRPEHGFGKVLNPCVDCKILLLREARKYMESVGAKALASGEVLGQRPMSQRRDTLNVIMRDAAVADILLRPLCAKHLPPTPVEESGLVDRSRLLGIWGRGRTEQLSLAKEYGIKEIPTPGGGCRLTERENARRYWLVLTRLPEPSASDFTLANLGRQFWHSEGQNHYWLCVGRNSADNDLLAAAAGPDDLILRMRDMPGPLALARNGALWPEDVLRTACQMTASYAPKAVATGGDVFVRARRGEEFTDVSVPTQRCEDLWNEPAWDEIKGVIRAEARERQAAQDAAKAAAREARYEAERLEAGREDDPTGA
ncbi:tRNA(5-methylaminomethyl-2-thiouridylate) methyltransferase [Desulfovibrio desulfuricans]|uniref:tRNA(5-methylaminomethyl-2-thiouridylate) methyltransferase n=1 Tax=Desulfovibrio desulfuricans TaxID=876 RepID=UPI00177C64AC|nr:tRNA(5-methylaminomethyl-2-thiouridylate) methyltransferase [Desulfovibrio desulfuricans]MBD8895949.1 tRNA(5-methylaminomethyl-2-thiouridylate) methyltransferase [Desulfovibrio desulfuricans]